MGRRPPKSTRTDTLVPYTTRVRAAPPPPSVVPLPVPGRIGSNRSLPAESPTPSPIVAANSPAPTARRSNHDAGSPPPPLPPPPGADNIRRSEEHTSELQSLMRISYAVFCLKKKKTTNKKSRYQK